VDGKKRSKGIGFVKEMTKSEAREAVAKIVEAERAKRESNRVWQFGSSSSMSTFRTTAGVEALDARQQHKPTFCSSRSAIRRSAARHSQAGRVAGPAGPEGEAEELSFSVVDHLRWDPKQIFDVAVAEGHIRLNPALLLFTPKEAKEPVRRAMTIKEVQLCFSALDQRERLIAKLATLAGMRPGEIFALKWGGLAATHAEIRQRVYRNRIDTPKTDNSYWKAALSEGVLPEIENWKLRSVSTRDAWVFPSERMTPMAKDNCWRRIMHPALEKVGLGWANFLVMRRTHSSLMKELKADPKLVADQLEHTVDVNLNVYTQSPVVSRLVIVNQLENLLVQ